MVCDAQGPRLCLALTGGYAVDALQTISLLNAIETGWVIAYRGNESTKVLALSGQRAAKRPYYPNQTGRTIENMTGNSTGSET